MSTPHPAPDLFIERFSAIADLAKTLGTPQRLALLELAQQGEKSVEALAALSGLSVSNTSQHLQQLRRAGFLRSRRNGKHMLYSTSEGPLADIVAALERYASYQQDQMRQTLIDSRNRATTMEQVSVQELVQRMQDGTVVLLDVRPESEYAAAHVPGALSIPVGELAAHLQALPDHTHIIAYCRDPYCVLSVEAVKLLQAQGKPAQRLMGGIAEWIAAGLKVATGR